MKNISCVSLKFILGVVALVLLVWAVGFLQKRDISPQEIGLVKQLSQAKTFSNQILRDVHLLSSDQKEKMKICYDDAQVSVNSTIDLIVYCLKNHDNCLKQEIISSFSEFKEKYKKLILFKEEIDRYKSKNMEGAQNHVMDFYGKTLPLSPSEIGEIVTEISSIINAPYEKSYQQLETYKWDLFPAVSNLSKKSNPISGIMSQSPIS